MLTPNSSRMEFYKALKDMKFTIPESAKEDEVEYFEVLGSFDSDLEKLVMLFRKKEDLSTAGYNSKIPNLIKSYNLTTESIGESLLKVSAGDKRGKDVFWFIQDPVKFEFLITLYAYCIFGNDFEYKPNFICDEAGIPYSHAPGNIGDIEIFNKNLYWLIEATLIRGKNQQVNNETVNLFRHINTDRVGSKYLTLIAPYIHDDTKLIFNVASVITMIQDNMSSLYSTAQTTENFVDDIKTGNYFPTVRMRAHEFIIDLREKLNSITTLCWDDQE